MTGIAKVFSTIDSIKRVLGDALASPADFLKTSGVASREQGVDKPLKSDAQMAAGAEEMAMNFMPGAMIVPAADVLGFSLFNGLQRSLRTGADPQKVAVNSGVFNMPQDLQLRTLVSDLAAKLRVDHTVPIPEGAVMKDVLSHQELYNVYPDLGVLPVTALSPNSAARASLYKGVNNPVGTIAVKPTASGEEMVSSLLHELQHAVDLKANLQAGGSPSQFLLDRRRLTTGIKEARTMYENSLVNGSSDVLTQQLRQDVNALIRAHNKAGKEYSKIPGEVSARLTQKLRETGSDEAIDVLNYLRKPEFEISTTPSTIKFDAAPDIQSLLNFYAPSVNKP
jgi:hypothetical protein